MTPAHEVRSRIEYDPIDGPETQAEVALDLRIVEARYPADVRAEVLADTGRLQARGHPHDGVADAVVEADPRQAVARVAAGRKQSGRLAHGHRAGHAQVAALRRGSVHRAHVGVGHVAHVDDAPRQAHNARIHTVE